MPVNISAAVGLVVCSPCVSTPLVVILTVSSLSSGLDLPEALEMVMFEFAAVKTAAAFE